MGLCACIIRRLAMKRIFRPSIPADAPQIAGLLAQVGLQANTDPIHLHWKCWQKREDWPGPRSFVLTAAEEVIAHVNAVPGVLLGGARHARVIHGTDWAARPDAFGAGVSVLRQAGLRADALLSIGGSRHTRSILPQIGFKRREDVTNYVRTLRPSRLFSARALVGWKLLPRFVRSAAWTLTAPRVDTKGWEVRRIYPGELVRIREALPTPTTTMAVMQRSVDLLRHMLACPIVTMELHSLERAGAVRGYFLLAFAPRQARLADCWMTSSDPADWRVLIECAVQRARENRDCAEIAAWANDPILSDCLRMCGFHARGTQPVQVMSRGRYAVPNSLIRLQMLDSDAAYLPGGLKALLA